MVSNWTRDKRDTNGTYSGGSTAEFTVTNIANDLTLDCNANDDLATADVLGTLIRILIERGVIEGTVA